MGFPIFIRFDQECIGSRVEPIRATSELTVDRVSSEDRVSSVPVPPKQYIRSNVSYCRLYSGHKTTHRLHCITLRGIVDRCGGDWHVHRASAMLHPWILASVRI